MNPDTLKILWDLFGLPLLTVVLILLFDAAFSAWIDYQKQKGGR